MRHFRQQSESKLYVDHENRMVELETHRKYFKVKKLVGKATVLYVSKETNQVRYELDGVQYETTKVEWISKDLDSYFDHHAVKFDIDNILADPYLLEKLRNTGTPSLDNDNWIKLLK